MRTFVPQVLLPMLGIVWMLGCGGSSNSAPIQKPKESNPVIMPPAPQQPTTNSAPVAATPKPSTKSSSKKASLPDNADPKTIYVVSSIGFPMDVMANDGVIPANQYEVTFADVSKTSANFTIDSYGPSSQPHSLIGKGSPKAGFSLPKGFTEFKPMGYDASGLPLRIVCTKTGTQLALVPAGTSIVGTDEGPDECQPAFTVTLDPFYMEIMEVTVRDYEKYRSEMREKKKPLPPTPVDLDEDPEFPVLGVSWAGAQGYVHWAGMELPTEAEFEKAARGPKGLRTPWGDGKPLWGNRGLSKTGAYREDTSPFGILDLAGNAKEWCSDLFSATAHSDASAASLKEALRNWGGPKKVRDMNLRVVKGNGPDWSVWNRDGKDMQKVVNDIGFRGVLRITSETKAEPKSKKGSEDSKSSDKKF